jgi:hypothetical protein
MNNRPTLDFLFHSKRPEVIRVPQVERKYYTYLTLKEAEERREVVLAGEDPSVLDVQVIRIKLTEKNHRNIEVVYQVKVTFVG